MASSTGPNTAAASRSSFFDSRSSSDKSESKNVSRSPSKTRDVDQLQPAERRPSAISFNERPMEREPSPFNGGRRPGDMIETPRGPIRRGTLESLGALSVQSYPENLDPREPKWPKDWRAYMALFGGFLLMFNSWGLVNAYGTYSSYYMQELLPGQDILLLNLVGSTQSFMVLALSAVVGRFLDAGYIRILLIIGTFFVSLGSFLLSIVNGDGEYGQGSYGLIWLTQGLVSGLGMACFFVSSSQVVGTWFKAKKGLAIGIVASGASIAGLLYPYMTRELISRHGFNIATRYVATVICVTCIMAVCMARPNPEFVLRKPDQWTFTVFVDVHAYQNRAYSWFCASIAILFFGFYAIFFNLEEWAVSEGFGFRGANNVGLNSGIPAHQAEDRIATFWLLAIMNASSTIGRVGSAYLCDHFGALNVHCATTTVAAILTLCLWPFANGLNSAIAFVVVFGAFSGSVIGLPPASVAYILGPNPHAQAKLGQWTGMMYTGAAIFALTGPVIAGHLITEYSSFLTVQMWSGACLLLSAGCMACAIWCRKHGSAPKPDTLESVPTASTQTSQGEKVEGSKEREYV